MAREFFETIAHVLITHFNINGFTLLRFAALPGWHSLCQLSLVLSKDVVIEVIFDLLYCNLDKFTFSSCRCKESELFAHPWCCQM